MLYNVSLSLSLTRTMSASGLTTPTGKGALPPGTRPEDQQITPLSMAASNTHAMLRGEQHTAIAISRFGSQNGETQASCMGTNSSRP